MKLGKLRYFMKFLQKPGPELRPLFTPNNNIRTPQASLNPGVGLDRRDLVVRSCSNYALTAMDVDSAES